MATKNSRVRHALTAACSSRPAGCAMGIDLASRSTAVAGFNQTVLYLRVSTVEQKPDLQFDGLRRYAARAGLQIVGEYLDTAVSGRKQGRPRLDALMKAARNYEFDCVLVWKFDRFARHLLTAPLH